MISLELPIKRHTFAKRNQNLYQIEVLQSLKKRSEMRLIISIKNLFQNIGNKENFLKTKKVLERYNKQEVSRKDIDK